MKAYIHSIAASENSECDLRAIVPDPLMRRRMSRIVRDGVTAAAVCAEGREVDAIITATAYGCLADSEKFLRVVLDNDEQLLPPSAFIQSTFNTVGAAVALLQQRHCYNMTYAHGADGFGAAVLDALMLIDGQEARQVLVGAVEEVTPTLRTLLGRMRVHALPEQGGAFFFLLSAEEEGACAQIRVEATGGAAQTRYNDPLEPARRLYRLVSAGQRGTADLGNLKLEVKCL